MPVEVSDFFWADEKGALVDVKHSLHRFQRENRHHRLQVPEVLVAQTAGRNVAPKVAQQN